MKTSRVASLIGAAALTVALVGAPVAAAAYTYVEYWGGSLSTGQYKISATTKVQGAYTGGSNSINVTYYAQTVSSQYGIYASAETIGGTALVQHGTVTLAARCFHQPAWTAGPSTDYLSCAYLKP